jgi:hypothetical protein
MMKSLYPSLVLCFLLINIGCKKLNDPSAPDAPIPDFKLSTNNAYLTQVVELTPGEEIGKKLDWTCNFGDGSSAISGSTITKVSHMYVKRGTYPITYTAGANKFIQKINIYPGLRSYQIKSSLSKTLSVNTTVDDSATDGHSFPALKFSSISDTVYSPSAKNGVISIYGKFTTNRNEATDYRLSTNYTVSPYEHKVIELGDTTPVLVRAFDLNGVSFYKTATLSTMYDTVVKQ